MNARSSWIPEVRPLLTVFTGLLLLTAVAYPLAVTGVAQTAFPRQANGSLVRSAGEVVGSSLIGQDFRSAAYFHGRPSAVDYDASASGASNLGPTSALLIADVASRVAAFRAGNNVPDGVPLPADAVTASASGLDPHISPATARLQVPRVAAARGASEAEVYDLVEESVEQPVLGIFGEPRVNVLKLNLALDERFPRPE
jgi:K+-transporting ATPase ATPase C chain